MVGAFSALLSIASPPNAEFKDFSIATIYDWLDTEYYFSKPFNCVTHVL